VTDPLRRLLVQSSKSAGDGCRNLVNAIAPETLKGFDPDRIQIFSVVGP